MASFCKKLPECLLPCLSEPKTAGSKMLMLLTKAWQIRDGSNTPVTTYLGRKKKVTAQMLLWPEKSRVRIYEEQL